jgi:hypothetical protein
MNRMNIFQAFRSGRFSALVALVGLGLLFTASGAKAAGCGLAFKTAAAPSIPFLSPQGNESLNHQEGDESNKHASIVGLWHVIYTATSDTPGPIPVPPAPPSFQYVETFKMWHADGIEFENAIVPPAGGICYGVWKDIGHDSVKLHHIGLMFDSHGNLAFIFTVDEKDTVSAHGNAYTGTFDFRLWPPSFAAVGIGTPIQEISGTTAATRITVD